MLMCCEILEINQYSDEPRHQRRCLLKDLEDFRYTSEAQ